MVNEQNVAMDHKLTNESERADGAQTTPTIVLDSKAHTYTLPADVVAVPEKAFDKASRLAEILVDEKSAHFRSVDGVLFDAELKTLVRYPRKKHGPLYTVPDASSRSRRARFTVRSAALDHPARLARLDRRRAFAKCGLLNELDLPTASPRRRRRSRLSDAARRQHDRVESKLRSIDGRSSIKPRGP